MNRVIFPIVLAGLTLTIQQIAFAERLPQPTIGQMCDMADLVIEGENYAADRVRITRVWKAPPSWSKEIKEVRVPALPGLARLPTYLYLDVPKPQPLTTTTVTLFLNRDKDQSDAWVPLYTRKDASCGVIWWDASYCYLYTQNISGVYQLTLWHFPRRQKPNQKPLTPEQLREHVEGAFADNLRFAQHLAIADPQKRAEAIVKYLLPRTSPDKYSFHRFAAEKAVHDLGKDALPAIVAAMQAAPPGEDIHHLIARLWSLNASAAPAKPVLLKILERKDQNASSCIVALRYIGDPADAVSIRPFLSSTQRYTPHVAAEALAVLGDKQSFDAIAQLIPEDIKRDEVHGVVRLLNALHTLDPAKARPLAEKANTSPAMKPVIDQIEALKKP